MTLGEKFLTLPAVGASAQTIAKRGKLTPEVASIAIFVETFIGPLLSEESIAVLKVEDTGRPALERIAAVPFYEGLDGQELINAVENAILQNQQN